MDYEYFLRHRKNGCLKAFFGSSKLNVNNVKNFESVNYLVTVNTQFFLIIIITFLMV